MSLPENVKHEYVVGFGNRYSVTDDGRVYRHSGLISEGKQGQRLFKGRFMKLQPFKGYYRVMLNHPVTGKRVSKLVHRLIAEAFIPNPEGKPEVNHIDEVKTNNNVSNLEWATSQENVEHSKACTYELRHSDGTVITVFNLNKFCKEKGLSSGHMSAVVNGKRKTHKGWEAKRV